MLNIVVKNINLVQCTYFKRLSAVLKNTDGKYIILLRLQSIERILNYTHLQYRREVVIFYKSNNY